MSTVAAHIDEEDHGHHHKETFITKYIFITSPHIEFFNFDL